MAKVLTVAHQGMSTELVEVQVHLSPGLPTFSIVGLADKSIAESRERVRVALNSIGLSLPAKRITVNLSPADLFKEGTHYDLPIICGLLICMNVITQDALDNYLILGELSLDSNIERVSGTLLAAVQASKIKKSLICPIDNGPEAAWCGAISIITPRNIMDLINYTKGTFNTEIPVPKKITSNLISEDLQDIKGQFLAKRALEIAASGRHNMLISGPPGSGKSMLSKRIISIMPKLTPRELLENMMLYSIMNKINHNAALYANRPFIDPHHSCSMVSIIGGGRKALPGEVSMSNNGILFLDELPEFSRQTLDALRQPMENGYVLISRADHHVKYNAKFQLIAAMNPCKCGYLSDTIRACKRAPLCSTEYTKKISGPILDRIDIVIEMHYMNVSEMNKIKTSESSSIIKKRVINAHNIQDERYNCDVRNANINDDLWNKYCLNMCDSTKDLDKFAEDNRISMRSYTKVLKIARTIADLENNDKILRHHIMEAISLSKKNFHVQ